MCGNKLFIVYNCNWFSFLFVSFSKENSDYVTPGVIGLSFILLKTPQSTHLNNLAIKSLEQFVKKRYIFGAGIIKKLSDFLFADQEALQFYGIFLIKFVWCPSLKKALIKFLAISKTHFYFLDCLTRLSKTCSLTLAESVDLFKEILDFFLLVNDINEQ